VRSKTVEWQVCGVCNYDCTYCIQSPKTRVGHPSDDEVTRFLDFFTELPGSWEVKMTGGEPFAFPLFLERIVPGLIERTPHTVSVLTNLSAPRAQLQRFAHLTRGRLGIVSASIHLEHVDIEAFVEKARMFRDEIDPSASMVINAVLVPGRLDEVARAREAITSAGLRFFPQVMKLGGGTFNYEDDDRRAVNDLIGLRPNPRTANTSPSYRGRMCWTGVEYFVLTQRGDAFRCRTARRFDEGFLGNVLQETFALAAAPSPCTYDICPCTVPANRGMIES
jgi:MoaA/NifB/PqqE/SkfB family radical SAM enzyme